MDIEKELNKRQCEAVFTTEGPVLVLAGAGTGKTRVITYRIAHLIIDKEVNSSSILAVTFTNKAAEEMKSRLIDLIGDKCSDIWMGTFHAICLKILKREASKIGLATSFAVVDQEDRLAVIKQIVSELNIDSSEYKPKQYMNTISAFKNTEEYVDNEEPKEYFYKFQEVYKKYQESLDAQRLIDFDDMISLVVRLFKNNPDVLSYYKELFQYILVDEYQDTNAVQFRLLYLLSGENGNLCVVGDDDQSIYGWRGAEIRNILEFDLIFKNVKEIKLEGNYRSGQKILSIANRLIANNKYRRGKTLEASSGKEANVKTVVFDDERSEADFASSIIREIYKSDDDISNIAILYRTNAQSRNFEVALNKSNIPYKVIGGTGFYQRREIKDILSYLRLFDNPYDIQSFRRSIKTPKRGIGDATINKITAVAEANEISLIDSLQSGIKSLAKFQDIINEYLAIHFTIGEMQSLREKVEAVIEMTNYEEYLNQEMKDREEVESRLENLYELCKAAEEFDKNNEEASLGDFLASTSLITSEDDDTRGSVKLMTIHAAKGLEFKTVFLTGLEEGLFPLSNIDGESNTEEERRLCYVGVTRAMEKLYITLSKSRQRYNKHQFTSPSRFIKELGLDHEYSKSANFGSSGGMISRPAKKEYLDEKSTRFTPSTPVIHSTLGSGIVLYSESYGNDEKVTVNFRNGGIKMILGSFLEIKND